MMSDYLNDVMKDKPKGTNKLVINKLIDFVWKQFFVKNPFKIIIFEV